MAVKVISPPSQVIKPADLKLQARVTTDSEDSLFFVYLEAARALCELYTGRSIGSQTLELPLDAFPSGAIELPSGPVTKIESVKYADPSTFFRLTVDPLQYYLDNYGPQHWLIPAYGTSWPAAAAMPNSVAIRYVAGDVPEAVQMALMLLVSFFYDNREAATSMSINELPFGVKPLLDTCRLRLGLA